VEAIGPFDARVGLSGALPRNVRNFYGLGNETAFVDDDVARLNLARVQADLGLEVGLGPGAFVSLGPTIRYADPSRDDTLFTGPLAVLPDAAYESQAHAGGVGRVVFSTVDTPGNPKQGVRLVLEGAALAGIGGEAAPYGTVGGTLATFVPINLAPQVTLALRAGGSHRIGAFPFFDAAVIGQAASVRGFRRERFAGRSAAFGNAEVRLKLFELPTYLVPFDVGVLGFADAGRVWIGTGDDVAGIENPIVADGDEIHLGYGGGLWFGVLDRAALVLTAQISEEETLASFGVGFHF
ncbi:BamA/TamA family outer membrane protein, partial [Rubrivirga sp.]|uniref:BamA/TamA family outer membrane protein n=1 Tax=Rubrivirga sp. TaxID=1885344 RepID=UPI003C7762F2